MSYDKSFIEKQREILLAEKKRIEDETKNLDTYPDYGDSDDDNVQELGDFESNQIIDEKMENILEEINASLLAIDNGTYGICANCNMEIGEERLKALPWAKLCINCDNK